MPYHFNAENPPPSLAAIIDMVIADVAEAAQRPLPPMMADTIRQAFWVGAESFLLMSIAERQGLVSLDFVDETWAHIQSATVPSTSH